MDGQGRLLAWNGILIFKVGQSAQGHRIPNGIKWDIRKWDNHNHLRGSLKTHLKTFRWYIFPTTSPVKITSVIQQPQKFLFDHGERKTRIKNFVNADFNIYTNKSQFSIKVFGIFENYEFQNITPKNWKRIIKTTKYGWLEMNVSYKYKSHPPVLIVPWPPSHDH